MFDIILFDLDGTLTDPKTGITTCVQYALNAIGIDEPDNDKLAPFIGPPLKEMFMSYCNVDSDMGDFLVEKYRERFSTIGKFENEVYDGIPQLLDKLKRNNKTIALATSKPQIFSEQILEHFHIKQYFDILVGSELNGERVHKIDIINEVISRAGGRFDSAKTAMVGDRKYDIEGAKSCGICSVGVLYGYGGYEELSAAGADYIVENVRSLEKLLLEE
ncbi:MAG: HAD hydrolase-like protein [Lachnospiraceae bacterium]|nr:HAD hydrolase-like protein [Lachnospiraceae bacterium]